MYEQVNKTWNNVNSTILNSYSLVRRRYSSIALEKTASANRSETHKLVYSKLPKLLAQSIFSVWFTLLMKVKGEYRGEGSTIALLIHRYVLQMQCVCGKHWQFSNSSKKLRMQFQFNISGNFRFLYVTRKGYKKITTTRPYLYVYMYFCGCMSPQSCTNLKLIMYLLCILRSDVKIRDKNSGSATI